MDNTLLFLSSAALLTFSAKACERYLGQEGLIVWICLSAVFANLFVLKQITLFGLQATASDMFTISGLLSLNRLQQLGGMALAQKTIILTCISLVFFCGVSQIHLGYTPSAYDHSQTAYALILSPVPRLLFASFLAFVTSQQVNVWLYHVLSLKQPHRPLANQGLSLLCAQLCDTILFTYVGLGNQGMVLNEVVLTSFLIKIVTVLLLLGCQ